MTLKQEQAIRTHGEQLNAIFHTGLDPVVLCRKLRRIEGAAHKLAEDCCNFLSMESPEFDRRHLRIFNRIRETLGAMGHTHSIKINLDPRGYALKIDSDYMKDHELKLSRDWGGYGILAPEIDKDGS